MKKAVTVPMALLILGSASFRPANGATSPGLSPQGQFSLIRRIEVGVSGSPAADIDGVGDVNGDGVPDVIAGMGWAGEGVGAAWVYSGADGTLLHAFEGANADDSLGVSVNGPGDLNGDGVPDVVVGATGAGSGHGSITAFSGSDWSPLYTLNGGSSDWALGVAVSDAPDANGDGVRELLVARWEPGDPWPGYVDVRSGSNADLLHSLGPIENYDIFKALEGAPVGDFNGDGIDDWGVYFATSEFDLCGVVGSIIYSGATSEVLFTSPLEDENCTMGKGGIAAAGDVNADGFDDFWMSWAGGKCFGGPVRGAVRLYLGPSGAVHYQSCGDLAFSGFGESLTAVDDLNCDGVSDLVIGAPFSDLGDTNAGILDLLRGSSGGGFDTLAGEVADGRLGTALANVGDIDGDGPADIAAISFQQPGWKPVIELIKVQTGLNRCYLTRVRQDQGFDVASAPSPQDLHAWWNAPSPYKYIGIYFGGSTRYDQDQFELNREGWLAEVASYGWQFIPIWAGPMSPCHRYEDDAYQHIHTDPDLAEEDGRQEARLAVDRAAELGLVGPSKNGTVIYYDIEGADAKDKNGEPLDPNVLLQCTQAVRSFVTGWVSELHFLGNTAGVYANATDVMSLTDYGGVEPDAVWIANWYPSPQLYRSDAEVINISGVPNDVWDDHNRLRQYAGDIDGESYGGVGFDSVDANIADGLVAVLPGTMPVAQASSRPTPQLPTLSPDAGSSQIHAMKLLTASDGWVWMGDQVLWTHTGGATWESITPGALSDKAIMAVGFLDSSFGWLVSAQWQEVDGTVQLRVSQTTNGGHTWTTQPMLDPAQTGYPAQIHMDFIDPLNGWVVVRQQTCSNASDGLLFRTDDGGDTWMQLTIPSGNPVRFVTSLHGWTLGGPIRDTLYETLDGGVSWTERPVIPDVDLRYNIYDLPTFTSAQDGVLPIMGAEVDQTDVWLFVTHNGGATWWPGPSEHIDRHVGPINVFPIEVIDLEHYVAPTSGGLPGQAGGVAALSFISPDVGWAVTGDGNCQEVGEQITCDPTSDLLATSDGGDTWREVALPLAILFLPIIMR